MLVTWPGFGIASITWTPDRPAVVNRSAYTGKRSVAANPWHGKRTARVALAPVVGAENFWAIRAFMMSLRGAVNTFRLPTSEGEQTTLPAATVQASVAQAATALVVAGCYLKPGQEVTINDQILTVVTSAPSGSNCAITFEPALRAAASTGTAIETANPTCLVALVDSSFSWTVDKGQNYTCSFDVEEVF